MPTCPTCGKEPITEKKAEVLAEHFQKTFELNHSLWEERNKNFLVLLGVTGVELLLIYRTEGVVSVLADFYSKFLKEKTPEAIASGFPFNLLISILLVVILYLMIQISHRTRHIKRNYGYLEQVESDLRNTLEIKSGHSLTREGDYYRNNQSYIFKLTGIVYALLLGALLLIVDYGKLRPLRPTSTISIETLLPAVDVLVLVMTTIFYIDYLYLSLEKYVSHERSQHVWGSIKTWLSDLRQRMRTWRELGSSDKFLRMLFPAMLLYGLPYSLSTAIVNYLLIFGIEWPTLSWLNVIKALILITLLTFIFGIFSCIWLFRIRRQWTIQQSASE